MRSRSPHFLDALFMLVCYVTAFWMPFELFIFAYAGLGPLHYLTEIPWLQSKNYFTKQTAQTWWLWLLAGAITVAVLGGVGRLGACISFVALGSALAFTCIEKRKHQAEVIAVSVLLAPLISFSEPFVFLFGLYLTTIIHVFLFTLLFMIRGWMRSPSMAGAIPPVLLVLCAVSYFVNIPSAEGYQISQELRFRASILGDLHLHLANLITGNSGNWDYIVAAMRFVAFAYSYHYVNWFLKTGVVGWHKIGTQRLVIAAALYGVSLLLYLLDYAVGIKVLFFLSLAHVYLEFPLNLQTLSGIHSEMPRMLMLAMPAGKGRVVEQS